MSYTPSSNYLTVRRLWSIMSSFKTKIATALGGKQDSLTTQTAYTSKGSATKVPQITTNTLGQVTGITEVTITGVTPASHTHGNIANGGTLTDTAAAAAGNDYVVIRDADNAKIQTSTIKGTDVADAVSKKHEHSTLTLSTTAQAYDGTHTLALPASDPYTSARTPASHTHGNITNAGGITASGVTIANGDSLAIVDSSETNKLIAKSSITFDGSTTSKALSQKGTFETFLTSHQSITGKMNTSADNATAPTSSSSGDGATATLLNNLSDGSGDISTSNGDNVLIATTDNGGTVTNKWYKRPLVKLVPWIINKLGTQLVYDCGAGSTSSDDFNAALAAFTAGKWVIIHKDDNVYYCVGTFQSSLRFRKLSNSGTGISVSTLNWTSGSAPTALTQIDASLSGHTHTRSDITNFAHTHNTDANEVTDSTAASSLGEFTDTTEIVTTSTGGYSSSDKKLYRRPALSKLLPWIKNKLGTAAVKDVPSSGDASSSQVVLGNDSRLSDSRDPKCINANTSNVGAKRVLLGYATVSSAADFMMKCLVQMELSHISGSGSTIYAQDGSSLLMLVSVSGHGTYRYAQGSIIQNTYWDGRTRPVILTELVDNKMYVYVGIFGNNSSTLVDFQYTRTTVTKLGVTLNWSWDVGYDTTTTYDYVFYCEDSVKFVPTVNNTTVNGNPGIGSNTPADQCVTYWSAMQPGCIRMVYNQTGTEYTLIFSKSAGGGYGTILKWSYSDNYIRMIRIRNNNVESGSDWVKVSAGYADTAGSFSSSVNAGSTNQPVYISNGVPTACNWWVS